MITVDGAQGEGGGQVLRTSLALAILTNQPVHIQRIRANRRSPGLAPQHLAGVLAAAQISQAEVTGASLRSTELTFTSGSPPIAGDYHFDVSELAGKGSAGAITLVLQSILLPLALAKGPSRVTLRGGTSVAWSPPAYYLEHVLLPTLARVGVHAQSSLVAHGWYPVGGGQLELTVQGDAILTGVDLTERGELRDIQGVGLASNLPSHIPQRISDRANNALRDVGLPAHVQPERTGGPSTGAGFFLHMENENTRAGFSSLGERGKPSEKVADEAASAAIAYHQQPMALDPYLPDQILLALSLAHGLSALSTITITRHTLTNIAIIQHFIQRDIQVNGQEGTPGTIIVSGE